MGQAAMYGSAERMAKKMEAAMGREMAIRMIRASLKVAEAKLALPGSVERECKAEVKRHKMMLAVLGAEE
jgi:hypothetical protein